MHGNDNRIWDQERIEAFIDAIQRALQGDYSVLPEATGENDQLDTLAVKLKELIVRSKQAEEHDRLKSAFLANMSHEIRTPMNGILGFASLLKRPGLTEEKYLTYADIIEKGGERVLGIINDLIEISRIEAGQATINLTPTHINEQIEFIYAFFRPEAEGKGIQIILECRLSPEDTMVLTDREKVYAILTNLVKNAIKFTREGSIKLGCRKKGRGLEFYVKDTGMGIAADRQKEVFKRYVKEESTVMQPYEGAGLGLAISKAYVEMLGGEIWVESMVGEGSQFYFTIPCRSHARKRI
jgi:hypothetical protein